MSAPTEYLGWHFSMGVLAHGDGRPIVAGETHIVTGAIVPCTHGLHASARPLDALGYADSAVTTVARVRLHGTIVLHGTDKAAASHRAYLAVAPCGPLLHEFACRCAEVALMVAHVDDERCWQAIHVKREWLAGRATDQELAAAGAAAWAAARAAALAAARAAALAAAWAAALAAAGAAALAAAWAAAGDAAWDAARDAALAAAWAAAWAAAGDAVGVEANDLLTAMLTDAMEGREP
jgi:hypothetical protein